MLFIWQKGEAMGQEITSTRFKYYEFHRSS